MRKFLSIIISFIMLLVFSGSALAADFTLDTSKADLGLLIVENIKDTGHRVRVRIMKGEEKYLYEVRSDRAAENYPLQMGSGEYKVDILENIIDSRYRVLHSYTVKAEIENALDVFKNSIQPVYWQDGMQAVKYAESVQKSDHTDDEKIQTIYRHMIYNYQYDWDKYGKLPVTYVPDIDEVYIEKKGVCYDYASLTASLLRSMGYPTRLVKGYSTKVDGYHAWNEVYMDGQWVVVDTTYDSMADKQKTTFAKKDSDYQAVGIF